MRVVRVGFAALKGTRHTAYDAVELDVDGAVGDRLFCLVDVAARRVLRTIENPSLVAVRTSWDGSRLDTTLPSGEMASGVPTASGQTLTSDYWGRPVDLALLGGPHAELLSSYLGRPVRLAQAPRGGVIYGSSVSLIMTASLRALEARLGCDLDPARFRPTIVVDAGDEPFVEDGWLGSDLRLGEAMIRIGVAIPRCAVIDLDPVTAERDARLLKSLASMRPADGPLQLGFGLDAAVRAGASVRPGDEVEVL